MYGWLCLTVLMIAITSCEKLDVPTEENVQPDHVEKDTTSIPVPSSESPDSLSTEDLIDYVEYYGSTEETAYSVHDVLHFVQRYLNSYDAIGYPNCYVGGFIVGFVSTNNISRTVFSHGDIETNIVLADSIGETDYHNCIAVQLSTSTKGQKKVREELNLSTHPENLGAYVILHGTITKYMGALGLKSVNNAVIYDE